MNCDNSEVLLIVSVLLLLNLLWQAKAFLLLLDVRRCRCRVRTLLLLWWCTCGAIWVCLGQTLWLLHGIGTVDLLLGLLILLVVVGRSLVLVLLVVLVRLLLLHQRLLLVVVVLRVGIHFCNSNSIVSFYLLLSLCSI